jgi:hypothetical protein
MLCGDLLRLKKRIEVMRNDPFLGAFWRLDVVTTRYELHRQHDTSNLSDLLNRPCLSDEYVIGLDELVQAEQQKAGVEMESVGHTSAMKRSLNGCIRTTTFFVHHFEHRSPLNGIII